MFALLINSGYQYNNAPRNVTFPIVSIFLRQRLNLAAFIAYFLSRRITIYSSQQSITRLYSPLKRTTQHNGSA